MIPWHDLGFALWLGLLTSISPCPLATNIAAISYLGRQVERRSRAVLAGLSYAAGRTTVYVVLGFFLVSSTQAVPGLSMAMQRYTDRFLGPLLVLVGSFLLNVFKWNRGGPVAGEKTRKRLSGKGIPGAYLLGILFALSFCPVSAALFFGNTLTLAVRLHSRIVIPGLYGLGTALPAVVFSLLIAYSVHAVGRVFNRLTLFEKWARLVSGGVFIAAGIYYTVLNFIL
jgi:cytochrome c biogenesis protein CcdA